MNNDIPEPEKEPFTKPFPYNPLSRQEIEAIHETSMKVLEEVGFEVREPEAFALFKKIGASVDSEKRVVYLKERMVRDLISTVPSEITLCGRKDKHNIELGCGNVYFGTGGTALNVLDYDSGKERSANLQDLIDIVRIVDQLDNIHLMLLPTYPGDLPVDGVDVNRFFAGMCFTSKHVMGGVYTMAGIHDVIEIAETIAGSKESFRERPFISMIACGISPLRLDEKYGAFMIHLARESIPTAVPVEPLCGATAPASLAGTLVIQTCDGLIHIMLTQLANPGAPVIFGCVATSINFQDMSYLGGPVESGLLNAATAQIARFYGFPYYSTAGISDSKTLDAQCGYETAINNLLVALAGGDFIHDAAGLMEFATTLSKEKLVIDNDILGMVDRALRGIVVNKDTLSFEAIRNAGPGGNFVAARHTRRHMHKEHYFPPSTNREKREVWSSNGSKSSAERAHEKIQELLSQPPHFYTDKNLLTRLLKSFPKIKASHFERTQHAKSR
jgi:trimethylamine--corrinoid protein Co-methyltransferase